MIYVLVYFQILSGTTLPKPNPSTLPVYKLLVFQRKFPGIARFVTADIQAVVPTYSNDDQHTETWKMTQHDFMISTASTIAHPKPHVCHRKQALIQLFQFLSNLSLITWYKSILIFFDFCKRYVL